MYIQKDSSEQPDTLWINLHFFFFIRVLFTDILFHLPGIIQQPFCITALILHPEYHIDQINFLMKKMDILSFYLCCCKMKRRLKLLQYSCQFSCFVIIAYCLCHLYILPMYQLLFIGYVFVLPDQFFCIG